ncbi:LysR family transcriptional regulator [Halobacillus salinarum]|uniref:LysR family transcriptional regulator n=1 Tax=Halobacillus salinarum TaxID=2932257 RepID=A0ABY4ENT8_9BACI|nr:LysR family transcriptional regulator [Halobacillus salinarum]UOQ43766.1 LysR family transcriptional regulator [Halobacillus salinarum]
MNTEQLETFITLARTKNFTRTSETMNVVQSTITIRIKQLEEEVGKKLFVRGTRNVEITETGKAFYNYAEQALNLINEGVELARIQPTYRRRLVIGGLNSIWDTPIFNNIQQFKGINPDTAIRLITGHSSELIEKILYGLIDVGFVYQQPHSPTIHFKEIGEDEILLCGNPGVAEKLGRIKQQDLLELPYIHYNWGNEFSEWFRDNIGEHENVKYRVDHSGLALRLLLDGEGIGFMLKSIAKNHLINGALTQISMEGINKIPNRKIFMIFPKKKNLYEKIGDFTEYILDKKYKS